MNIALIFALVVIGLYLTYRLRQAEYDCEVWEDLNSKLARRVKSLEGLNQELRDALNLQEAEDLFFYPKHKPK